MSLVRSRWRAVWRRTAAVVLLGAGLQGCVYQQHVVDEPGEHISRDAIEAIIAQESPVLYRDGVTPMGVFFSQEHRIYVRADELPEPWVQAIVAAEDQRFFDHPGFDWRGIARAMLQNIQAGRVVAGGSTLTQQTAKNLYYRPDRSLRSKWEELVNALRLEAHYDKREILEFYANQFHVSANGRGLGIAARYFFDKTPDQLTTLECAFIAGLVKGPANYNPFVGATEEQRAEARRRAELRVDYVLDRMADMGALDPETHAELKAQDIPFKRGTFRYDSSVLVDEVAARLEQAPYPEIFEALGIDNPSTAGVQVVTSLDVDAQREATYSVWHNLSEIGAWLEAPTAAALVRPPEEAPPSTPDDPLVAHTFSTGTVVSARPDSRTLTLDLGGRPCTVDREGVDRMARILAGARTARKRRSGDKQDVAAIFEALPVGTLTWASVRTADTCDLELRPSLQGGLVVLEEGAIRAMVGGNDNRNFNRAIEARRQLGSTWKILVYATAMHLGWTTTDRLDNRTGAFEFEGTWYFPRPDHSPQPFVSLDQAGTMSENLASIWLLHHLLDHVDAETFRAIAAGAGLTPESVGGDRDAWIRRVRDEYGVISTDGVLDRVAFTAARLEVLSEYDWDDPVRLEIQALLHGHGTVRATRDIGRRDSRRTEKLRALSFNAQRFADLLPTCSEQIRTLTRFAADAAVRPDRPGAGLPNIGLPQGALPAPLLPDVSQFSTLQYQLSEAGELSLACGTGDDTWAAVDGILLRRLSEPDAPRVPSALDLRLDGRLPVAAFARIQRTRQRRAAVLEGQDPYDFEVLRNHPDFRTLVALRHLAVRAASYGVQSDLPPVMSLPLGAADISIEEAALLIQGIATGQSWQFPGVVHLPDGSRERTAASGRPTLLIEEIRDRDGQVLWQADPQPVAVGDPAVGRMAGEVLRNVVRWGTGRRARTAASAGGAVVPLTGKTGTTNSFRNAAFCGFVPKADDTGWSWGDGYTIAAYVGNDDNAPMSRGGVRIAGASGALPGWMGTAAGLAEAGLLGTPGPGVGGELRVEGGYSRVAVRADGTGLWESVESADVTEADRYTVVWGAGVLADGTLDVERRLTLPPPLGTEPESRPLPSRAPALAPDAGELELEGEDIDPFISPEEEP